MLKNYFKIAIRNLQRSKAFSFINLTGLTIGMASAMLILLWVYDEISYDRFHTNKDHLYEVWSRGEYDSKLQCWNSTPKPLGPTLKTEYPEIADIAREHSRWFVTIAGEKRISAKALITDPSFLSMFSFPLLQGNSKTALNDVNSIVITKEMSLKMFGTENAMNKTIGIDNHNFTVTGVLKDLPSNSKFDFEYILPWQYMIATGRDDNNWRDNSINTYIQLKAGVTAGSVDEKIKDITKRYSKGEVKDEVFLHPITKWHLYSEFENGKIAGGRIETVKLFGLIAAFILLIACINFMNLSTARSEKRAKEVGVRKVTGARRGSLIFQFLGESVIMTFISGIATLVLVQIVLPLFETLVSKDLSIPYDNFYFWLIAFIFILVTGVLAGSYPAFLLSSFKTIHVLKGSFKKAYAQVNLRKVLVVLQFSFSIILIICTFIVIQQIRHAQSRNTGFNGNTLLYHVNTGSLKKNYSVLKNELLSSGVVSSITRTSSLLTEQFSSTTNIQWQGKSLTDNTDFERFAQDEGLIATAGLKLVKGRDMDLSKYPSDSTAMLLNESAARIMGFENPVGQLVKDDDNEYHVVGVVSDYVFDSPYEQTKPMVILGPKGIGFNIIHMRLNTAGDIVNELKIIESIFKKINPDYPFEYHFVSDDHTSKFADLKRTANLTGLFALLTIFISCLGLFGLVTYMAEVRLKEIGVRKVLGASVLRIVMLLSKDFLLLVGIAILIASPIAWYAMHTWLQNYSYRISIEWQVFLLAAILSVIISLVTISYQAIRAGLANPVKSLRTE